MPTKRTPSSKKVKVTYGGWQGHFICHVAWHLNTLVEYKGKKIVVSTVGQWTSSRDGGKCGYGKPNAKDPEDRWDEIGCDRKYETMVFESSYDEWDSADVTKQLDFLDVYNDERSAQTGHEQIVNAVIEHLSSPLLAEAGVNRSPSDL